MIKMVKAVLEREERFMLGDSFDGIEIFSYLQMNILTRTKVPPIRTDQRDMAIEKYLLNEGNISLSYNPRSDTLQVIMSKGTPVLIAENLQEIGRQSREREERNFKEYGVGGIN